MNTEEIKEALKKPHESLTLSQSKASVILGYVTALLEHNGKIESFDDFPDRERFSKFLVTVISAENIEELIEKAVSSRI